MYVDIMTGENNSTIVNMDITYWSGASSRRGGNKVKWMDGGIIIISSYQFHFIRVHDNLVKYSSNNKSIKRIYPYFRGTAL